MLKQLISLFAEKFLFNKKEWVGSQGLFSNSNLVPCNNNIFA